MYQYKAKVIKIIDGDTVDVDIDLGFSVTLAKQRIRLYGIDTPESRTRDKEEKVRGLLSKEFVISKSPVGSYITLVSHGKGKFGRILGEIYEADNDLVSINQQLCDKAYAVPYLGQSKDAIAALHAANRDILKARGEI
jgi:micrococcal nuclease